MYILLYNVCIYTTQTRIFRWRDREMRSHLSFPGRWWLCNPCLGQQGRCRGEVFLRSRSLRSLDMCRSFCDRVGWAMRKCGNPEESKTDSDKNQKRISVTKSDVEHLLDTPAHDPNFSCTRSSMRRRPSCWMGATGAKFDPQRFGDTSTRNVTKNTIEHTLYMCFGEQTYIQRSSTFLAGKEVAPTAVFDLVLNEWLDLQLVSPLVSPSAACHNVVSRVAHDSHHTYHTCHTCHTCLPWCLCDVAVMSLCSGRCESRLKSVGVGWKLRCLRWSVSTWQAHPCPGYARFLAIVTVPVSMWCKIVKTNKSYRSQQIITK